VSDISITDVREVFRLVAEISECARSQASWRQLMTERLCKLIGADSGLASASRVPIKYPLPPTSNAGLFGWPAENLDTWMSLSPESVRGDDPRVELGRQTASQITATRRELIDDDTWYNAPYTNALRRVLDVDDNLVSSYRLKHAGHWEIMAFFRSPGRPPFAAAEVGIVRLFHEEIGRLWDREAPTPVALPSRLQETLRGLMMGLSEKELAASLGLSQHTVHDYVKALHAKFRVRSRGELLAAASGRRETV
jgi:hypothetical protein